MLTQDDLKQLGNVFDGTPRVLGFRVTELIAVLAILGAVWAFYIRTNDAIQRLVVLGEYTTQFMRNSDSYNSAHTGIQFEQGKPWNTNIVSK